MRPAFLFFVVIALFLLMGSAFAQNVEYVGSALWSDISDVKVVGNYAYCAFTNGLGIFDVTDPASPSFVSKLHLQGEPSSIDVASNYAYMACGESGIAIINVADPANPSLVASYMTGASASDVFVSGSYAYGACGEDVQIIDVSDPTDPTRIGGYHTNGTINKIFVQGNYAYASDNGIFPPNLLIILNVSDPRNPVFVGCYGTGNQINDVFVQGNYAYTAEPVSESYYLWEMRIINISDPANPISVGSYTTMTRAMYVSVVGSYAYIARHSFYAERINVFPALLTLDITNPANPSPVDTIVVPEPSGLFVVDNYAFIPTEEYSPSSGEIYRPGLTLINVSNPVNPIFAGSYDAGYIIDVVAHNDYAYVADYQGGLQIINISDPANPVETGKYQTPDTLEGTARVIVQGDYAYLLVSDGMTILNISDPANPLYVGQYLSNNSPWGFYVLGSYAYLTDIMSGLLIIDISIPDHPVLLGTSELYFGMVDVVVRGNYAYAAENNGGLIIFDVTDPANPIQAGYYYQPSWWQGGGGPVAIQGNYAYLADIRVGLRVVDISDPSNPFLADSAGMPAEDVSIQGNCAFLAGEAGLGIVDITDPVNPVSVGGYDTPGFAGDAYVSGDYIYVADGTSLQILRFTPTGIEENDMLPNTFSLIQNYPNPFNAQTTIRYSLPSQSDVSIDIFDILGRKVETLVSGKQAAGSHSIIWDATNVTSGVYFYRIQAGDYADTKRCLLLK
jgi:hypothetical protein